jgi:F-type H+-transporting ATPase subunit b
MSEEKITEGGAHGDAAAGTHATTEALGGAAESHSDPSALGLDATMWVALAMLVVMGIFIWQRVPAMITKALDSKIASIRAQLDQASALRKDAEALKAEYQGKAKQADEDIAAMRANANREAQDIVAKARIDAEALIVRRTAMAEAKIAAAELAAIADVRATAAHVAATAASQIIASSHSAAADKALVDNAIAGLGRLN